MSSTTKAKSTSTKSHKASHTASATIAAAASSKGLGTTTTIIIAVVASVAGVLLVFFLTRFILHRRNRRSANPLPPVQPIAHHREQQLFQFEEAKFTSFSGSPRDSARGTWYAAQQHLAAPSPMPSGTGSDSSLVMNKEIDPFLGSAPPSPVPRRTSDQSIDARPRMSFDDIEKALPHPTPAFHNASNNSSAGSSRSSTPVSGTPPSAYSDSTAAYFAAPASGSHPLAGSTSARTPPRSRSPNQGGHPIRPRPSSLVSNNSRASRATNTIRGAPHGPHSNVQIILPAPLAPGLSPYNRDSSAERWGSGMVASDSRMSMVDQWAGLAAKREEPYKTQKDDKKRRVTKKSSLGGSSANDARHSIASSSHTHSSTSSLNPNNPFSSVNTPAPQRAQSQVYSSSPLSSTIGSSRAPSSPPSAFREPSPPPMPSMPTIHNQFSASGTGENEERGRQMNSSSESPAAESAIERRRSASRDRPVFFSPSSVSRSNSRTRTQS